MSESKGECRRYVSLWHVLGTNWGILWILVRFGETVCDPAGVKPRDTSLRWQILCLHVFEPGNFKMSSVLTEVSHLHFYGTWQGWLWRAWLDRRKLVTGVRISGKRSAHERHCDPACRCCYALGPDVCPYRCLHLLLRSRFDQDDRCGGRSLLPPRYPLPRALTLSLCPLNAKQGSAPSFSVE